MTLRLAHVVDNERRFLLFAIAIIALSKVNYKKMIKKGIERTERMKKESSKSNVI